jgi:5-methyltetrahydropteroyltriglutamate--homocysteine methyltransferase
MRGRAIRSEVIGSLLRPGYLTRAKQDVDENRLSARAYKALEDRAVDEAVALQQAAGLDVITDGEQRRPSFTGHMIEAIQGFARRGGWAITFRNEQGEELVADRPVVVEKLRWKRSLCGEDWVYLRATTQSPAKVTLVSAQQAAAYYDPVKSAGAYATLDSYLADVVDVTRREITELARLGCTYVQLDGPQYAALIDPVLREGYRQRGSDPDRLLDQCVELDNAIISGQPNVTFGLHVCRGNAQSKFYASGGYEPIARIFQKSRFDRFLLEYDDERSGGFEPLRNVPEDRVVVLGLVTTKKPQLEPEDQLRRSIEEASQFIPLERLALSPQCGFASAPGGNLLRPEDQRLKLELVSRVARSVWGPN